jgi:hypothetical protein
LPVDGNAVLFGDKKCKSENNCDSDLMNNWQHLCQKLDVPAEVTMNSFIGVDNGATVVQKVTKKGNWLMMFQRTTRRRRNNDKNKKVVVVIYLLSWTLPIWWEDFTVS